MKTITGYWEETEESNAGYFVIGVQEGLEEDHELVGAWFGGIPYELAESLGFCIQEE